MGFRLKRSREGLTGTGRSGAQLVVSAAAVVALAACSAGASPSTAATASTGAGASTGGTASTGAGASTSQTTPPQQGPSTDGATASWTVYHHDPGGSGAAPSGLNLSPIHAVWTSMSLDGALYGEPLVWSERVYEATENDTVYALKVSTGGVLWRRHLATPVPSGDLPCGNISPTVGITSTPVIDTARKEIFVVADELVNGAPRHELYGLSTASGAIELRQRVDPPGADTAAILQRASLTLDDGLVVFGFGGNDGDCSSYHGWVESVPETGGAATYFKADRGAGESQGAVWMGGGAPVIDSKGDVWVAVGNGSVTSASGPYDDSDSVLELSPALKLLQFFAPSDWYNDNERDFDLGSGVPAVLPNGLVVQAGKSQTAYLLKGDALGGIGGQLQQTTGICGNDVDGGVAFTGNTVYLPCENGVIAMATSAKTDSFSQLWQTPTGAGGPPILAGGLVWTIGGGNLYALSPATGASVQEVSIGGSATDFPTPAYGDGLLLAISATQVHAFAGP